MLYPFLFALGWIGAPILLQPVLQRRSLPPLPALALLIALAFCTAAIWEARILIFPPDQINGARYNDTYYLISKFHQLLGVGLSYGLIAAASWVVTLLAKGWTRILLAPAFWLFHLGSGLQIALNLYIRQNMPRRYIDFPAAFAHVNSVNTLSAFLAFLSIFLLFCLFVAAIIQALRRKPPRPD